MTESAGPQLGRNFGKILDYEDTAITTHISAAIPIRRDGWSTFSGRCELANSSLKIFARPTNESDDVFVDATSGFIQVDEITEDAYFEITLPTAAWEVQIRCDVSVDSDNTSKVWFSVR